MTPTTSSEPGLGHSWPAAVAVGLVVGFMLVAFVVSFASLLFAGPASRFLGLGVALLLFAAALHNLIAARWSTVKGAVMLPQDATTAVVAAGLAAMLPVVSPDAGVGTVIFYTACCTAAVAVVMFALGSFRLGGLVRFVPVPVVGGFLAGTGWLLVKGGAELATAGFSWNSVGAFSVAASTALGLGLLLLLRYRPHVAILPSIVGAAVVLFFVALAVSGISLDEARRLGLLPVTQAGEAPSLSAIFAVDWSAFGRGMGGLVSVPFVATMALLLNVTALDVMRGDDADLDRELRTVGLANLVTAPLGSPGGYHALGPTAIAFRLNVKDRLVPIVAAGVCIAAAASGPFSVGLIPIPVVAGLLVFLGLGFMVDWLVDRRRQMSRSELVVMLTIVAMVATLGLMAAVAWGMVAAVILFVVAYSRLDPIRSISSGQERRSTVDRPPAAAAHLDGAASSILLVELQGFLFFGSCHGVVDRIREEIRPDDPFEVLVVDFHHVQGVDSTALTTFVRLARICSDLKCGLILSAVPAALSPAINEAMGPTEASWRESKDADHALEMAEERLLENLAADTPTGQDLFGIELWSRLVQRMERVEIGADEVIIEHGDVGAGLIAVDAGEVVTEIPTPGGGWKRVRRSGPGTVVGEMSLYRSGGRTARVRTTEPSTLFFLDGAAVTDLEQMDPGTAAGLHRGLAKILAERVEHGNDAIRWLLGSTSSGSRESAAEKTGR